MATEENIADEDFEEERLEGAVGGVSNEFEVEDITIIRPHSSQEIRDQEMVEPRAESAPPRLSADDVQIRILQEIEELNKKFDNISIKKQEQGLDENRPDDEGDEQNQIYRLKAARNVEELCNFSDHLEISEDKSYISCLPCTGSQTTTGGHFKVNILEDGDSNDKELTRKKSLVLSNLKMKVHRHLESSMHREMVKLESAPKKTEGKTHKVGMIVSAIAYEIIFEGHSFREFERRLALLDLQGVDVGNLNHSCKFVPSFLSAVHDEIRDSVARFLRTPLPFTNQLPSLCMKPDKFTNKKQGSQALIVRHPFMKNGILFRETYVDHPKVTECGSEHWVRLMIDAIKKKFGYSDAEIRRSFAADCADGQYIKCNIDRHLALILSLDIEFTNEVSIWDYNHKTERSDYHTRKANQWINKLDDLIKAIMKEMHEGEPRTCLIRICEENGIAFFEFVFYSDTRFTEYRFRTYKVIILMWLALYLYYQRLASSDTNEAVDFQEKLKWLQDPEVALKLCFMYDLSNIITRCEKQCQDQKLLPAERKQKVELFISQLRAAHSAFATNQIPESFDVDGGNALPKWKAWKFFKDQCKEIFENKIFQGVPLLDRGQVGRASRGVSSGASEIEARGLKARMMPVFAKVLHDYIAKMNDYFEWPQWLILSELIFLWDNDCDDSFQNRLHFRLSKLDELMELPFRPEPLTEGEKPILKEQYKTLFITASEILKELGQEVNRQEVNRSIWYEICTSPVHYSPIKEILHFAMCFLVRDQNECSVESLIGDIERVDCSDKPRLVHETVTKIMFVKRNGPNPLLSNDVRKKALDRHFPNGWHFEVQQRLGKLHSSVVSRLLKDAKSSNNYCFE